MQKEEVYSEILCQVMQNKLKELMSNSGDTSIKQFKKVHVDC